MGRPYIFLITSLARGGEMGIGREVVRITPTRPQKITKPETPETLDHHLIFNPPPPHQEFIILKKVGGRWGREREEGRKKGRRGERRGGGGSGRGRERNRWEGRGRRRVRNEREKQPKWSAIHCIVDAYLSTF